VDDGAAEIIFVRHQLNVLRRRVPSNPKLAVADDSCRLVQLAAHPEYDGKDDQDCERHGDDGA
jgi:hypothetical protein